MYVTYITTLNNSFNELFAIKNKLFSINNSLNDLFSAILGHWSDFFHDVCFYNILRNPIHGMAFFRSAICLESQCLLSFSLFFFNFGNSRGI